MKKVLTVMVMASFILSAFGCGNKSNKQNDSTAANDGQKVLVAYFSATGTTEAVAKSIAEATGGDFFEIEPVKEYSSADLNWNDKKSRSTLEMNDKKSRPEISSKVEDIAKYDVVFLGYPIWWYTAPRIINTFLEQYDFSGKRIVLFATSGGSGFENSITDLQPSAPNATIEEGEILNGNPSVQKVKEWTDKILSAK